VSARDGDLEQLIDRLSRRETTQLVAGLTRIFGPAHMNLAEDAMMRRLVPLSASTSSLVRGERK